MLEDYQQQHQRRVARIRAMMDFTMGTILFLVGVYFLSYEKLHINVFNRSASSIDYLIGGLFVSYGIWRIYRGYKKDYFT